jgi:hypothetical protein
VVLASGKAWDVAIAHPDFSEEQAVDEKAVPVSEQDQPAFAA